MSSNAQKNLDALIIGAGFSGIYMLHLLRKKGFNALVIEAAPSVGGTWYWNRYPGARCDIPSIEYSYAFDEDLQQEWNWTERYATGGEILSYLDHVTDRFALRDGMVFETRVESATWDEDASCWAVSTDTGDDYCAQHLILATGALSQPNLPDLPGLDQFTGPVVMTAKWDESLDLTGKNICHFGTGSSGIQAVSEMAKVAGELTVFQRTPNFAVPASNRPLGADEIAEVKANYPALRETARNSPLGWFNAPLPGSAKQADPAERDTRFEQQWKAGTAGLLTAYEDLLFDDESNAFVTEFARGKIAQLVNDPETARKMTPHGYPMGSRRLCSEIGFYDAMNRDNVTLVDVREEPVTCITANEIVTAERSYPADILVFATGFDACVGAIKAINITGRNGQTIAEEWADGPRAYLGLAVSGFPNLFTITGPGSPSVLSNVVVSIEQHVEWVTRAMSDMRDTGKIVIEAKPQAEQEWMEHVNEIAHQTLFPKSNSWYQGKTRDGRKVFMPYVGGCGAYRQKCDDITEAGYSGFTLESAK